jgi:hypothetical protein
MAESSSTAAEQKTTMGRLRAKSQSLAETAWNFNPQPGMWAATGTAIAYAPTLTELREPVAGGENIEFNEHGHSARTVGVDGVGAPILLTKTNTRILEADGLELEAKQEGEEGKDRPTLIRSETLAQQAESDSKHTWTETISNGFKAFYKFASTPTGFLMTLYGLNIVAWGAMLFFLLLDAAPAMDHPNKDSVDSPRKKWLEIDSQILNALFCVTGFGLAPWRLRDLYWLAKARVWHDRYSMLRLEEQNRAWFRPPAWYDGGSGDEEMGGEREAEKRVTFTGEVAPPTRLWKLSFVVWMMVMNTLFQCALAGFMWGYNRINRPSWATGTFIALGCGVSLLAGVMMWWEGRKVKKIEGPMVKVVQVERKSHRPLR